MTARLLAWIGGVPWQAVVLAVLGTLVATAQWIRRQHLSESRAVVRPAVVPLPAPPAPRPAARRRMEPPKGTVQVAMEAMERGVTKPPSKSDPVPLVEDLRGELTIGLHIRDSMPRENLDGLAAARAIAQGKAPPPDRGALDEWVARVEGKLRAAGQESLADYFTGSYQGLSDMAGQMLAVQMAGPAADNRGRFLLSEMTGRCRLLAKVIETLGASSGNDGAPR